MGGGVVVVVPAAGTERVTGARAEPEDVAAVGNYQRSPFAEEGHLLEIQWAGAAEGETAGRETQLAAELDLPEESQAVESSDFEEGNRFAKGIDTLSGPGPTETLRRYGRKEKEKKSQCTITRGQTGCVDRSGRFDR